MGIREIFIFAVIVISGAAWADEWKNCSVTKSLASDKAVAIAAGKIEKKISFFKKPNYVFITIFLDGKTWAQTDLVQTGSRKMSDGATYLGYADKTNSLIVQEFEATNTMIVTLRGEIDFTFFASCS